MNRCARLRDDLEDVALGAAATPELSRHLAECSACAAELERQRALLQRIDAAVHAVVRAEPPAQLPAGVAARLTATRRPAIWNARRPWYAALAVATVAALLVSFGFRVLEPPPVSQTELSALTAWRSPTASLLAPIATVNLPQAHPNRTPGATHDS